MASEESKVNGASDPHVLSSKKVWVPLENNPDVMTKLAHKLGLSDRLVFVDVFSVTDETLLAMVPRPVYALLWLFPITEMGEEEYTSEESKLQKYEGCGSEEPVLWFHQTIGHACGLMGLLHCVTNGTPYEHIVPGSELDKLVQEALPVKPAARSDQLYNSQILEIVHKEAANQGDSRVPDPSEPVNYGFTAFVKGKDGNIWELEGRRKGPVNRGHLDEGEDILSERVLGLTVYPYINREKLTENGFSCTALVLASE